MRKLLGSIVAVALSASVGLAAEPAVSPAAKPVTAPAAKAADPEKTGYSVGYDIGKNLGRQGLDLPAEALLKGFSDGYQGKAGALSDQEMQSIKTAYQQQIMAKRAEAMKQAAAKNAKDGEAYLAENKKKEGVVTTASGVQYKILKDGTGKQPKATDTVKVQYRGTLPDGKEFDSSYKRGEPASFKVNGVIKGWTEALQLMKEGAKWQLVIPAALAYGERGMPGIGPNQVLLFDVELLEVLPAK